MTREITALVARARSHAIASLCAQTGASTDILALAGLVEEMDRELNAEIARRDIYRREAAIAVGAAQEALPLALGAIETTIALADRPLGVGAPVFSGHLIGLPVIARTIRDAALRCDALRPFIPPSPTA